MGKYTFRVRGNCGCTIPSLDCFSYDPHSLRGYDGYTIDMSALKFIHPTGVVGLLCLAERLSEWKKPLKIILPFSGEVCDYFAKIHLLDALKIFTVVKANQAALAIIMPRLTTILPVASFSTEMEVEALAQRIEKSMSEQGFANLLWPCYNIVAELASNVVQHSEAPRGWILAQGYGYPDGRMIEIAIGDSGIGFRRSLRRNPQLVNYITDDKVAVKKAVSERVSRYSHPLRGNGLFQVCTEVKAPDRRLTIRSGAGCLVVYDNGRHVASERAPIIGVLAEAKIPC